MHTKLSVSHAVMALLLLICSMMPAQANILTEASVGDTLQCTVKFRGKNLQDKFRYKKKYISLYGQEGVSGANTLLLACDLSVMNDKDIATPMDTIASGDTLAVNSTLSYWEWMCYAVVEEKNDSLCTLRVMHKKTDLEPKEWHLATIMLNPHTGSYEGDWKWYNWKHQLLNEEHFRHNAIERCESYWKKEHWTWCDYYEYRKSDVRDTIASRYTHRSDLFSPSGTKFAQTAYPKTRFGRTPKGTYDFMPTGVTYFDAEGNTISYENTEQVAKAVQQYIEKNFKQAKLSSIGARAAFDVVAKVDADGKITNVVANTGDVYLRCDKKFMDRRKDMVYTLKNYLTDELPKASIQAKPVRLDKQATECILLFTVVIH